MAFRVLPAWRQPRPAIFKSLIIFLTFFSFTSIYYIWSRPTVQATSTPYSDGPFQYGCAIPSQSGRKANATILMVARNKDVDGALHSIQSLERHFNRWFHYPVLFLNNEPFDAHFIQTLTNATSGEVTFDVIPKHMWDFPDFIDPKKARASFKEQEKKGIYNAGMESYHHMCRFFSGMFYDVPAIQKYRWFWRVEPDIDFSCSITYDPFIEMEKRGKKYGYTIALKEIGETVPSLFRLVDRYRRDFQQGTSLWNAFVESSWFPWPLTALIQHLPHHNEKGESWNMCHYWSNFEIADLDWFRSKQYRHCFDYLDRSGGFYFERFGDAPVHSFAASLFLQPSEIHHFEDFGYSHAPWWFQPHNALHGQLPGLDLGIEPWADEVSGASGCRCERDDRKTLTKTTNLKPYCLEKTGRALKTDLQRTERHA